MHKPSTDGALKPRFDLIDIQEIIPVRQVDEQFEKGKS